MPSTHSHYQDGSIARVTRAKGPDVWVFRWREPDATGKRVQKKRIIGDLQRLPTRSAAKKAVENLRAEINGESDRLGQLTFTELWGHFQANELRDPDVGRSATTIDVYLDNFRLHLVPRWRESLLKEVKAVDVEKWLRSLPYAPGTKSKLRNQMSCLFNYAVRHELFTGPNPISAVRQSSKRQAIPDLLTLAEIHLLLQRIENPAYRTMILIAAVTGLRRSEIRGLKWEDFDSPGLWLSLKRGCVRKHLTSLKTEASRRGIPVPQDLADALDVWRATSLYRASEDWVFASPTTGGRTPMWLDIVLQRHIRPVLKELNITKTVGWHTFRRSLGSLLGAKGENVKIIQELMRHANSSITLDLYQQADTNQKRAAQEHMSSLFLLKTG